MSETETQGMPSFENAEESFLEGVFPIVMGKHQQPKAPSTLQEGWFQG